MAASTYSAFLPLALNWIREKLESCADRKRSVESFGFPRLPLYFGSSLLQATSLILDDDPPLPPFSAWGLSEFAWPGLHPLAVTYLDTYFLETGAAYSEPLHFHELVHVVQWRVLGPEDFLLLYAAGLAQHGYGGSPLEAMAHQHQARFEAGGVPYSVEAEVGAQTLALLPAKPDPDPLSCQLALAGERSTFTCEVCGASPPRNRDGSATMWRCEACLRK